MKITPYQVTTEQKNKFRDDGFFITDVLFDTATLDSVQAEFQRMWNEDIAKAERSSDPKAAEFARLRGFFFHLEKRSPICGAFCRHPQLVSVASQMLGPDVDMGWDQAIAKAPSKGLPFAWHQDAYYAYADPKYLPPEVDRARYFTNDWGITYWVAITRTTIANGTMWAAPGMHRHGLLPHVWNEATRDWNCQFDDSGKVPVELQRGQALVFANLLPHYSGANVSNEVRMAYQISYSIPGVMKNEYQMPVLRNGQPA
jgi:phytanoyl-CoA hydroxylase